MPVVPFTQGPAPVPRQRVDPVFLIAAAADLHHAGMLVEPPQPPTPEPTPSPMKDAG